MSGDMPLCDYRLLDEVSFVHSLWLLGPTNNRDGMGHLLATMDQSLVDDAYGRRYNSSK